MEKKEVYICQQQYDLQEEEIDLRELFQTIWSYRKFLFLFSFIVTLISIIYSYSIKPVYQVESFVEIGYHNSNSNSNSNSKEYFIDPNSALIMIENKFKTKDSIPNLNSISFKKGTKFLDIKIDGYSNKEAVDYLNKIIDFLIKQENKKFNILVNNNSLKIKNLLKYKQTLNTQLVDFKQKLKTEKNPLIYQTIVDNINSLNSKIFDISEKIMNLKIEISPLNIVRTHKIGNILKDEFPIKPKKKLIVIVSFITSFILGIFLVFFIEFIKTTKEEEK